VSYLMDKVQRVDSAWLGIRFSFGMNGVLLRARDLRDFRAYLHKRMAALPPDMVYQAWLGEAKAARRRTQYVYRHNLLDHVGSVSSFAVRPHRGKWPRCLEDLALAWSLPPIDTFMSKACKHSDISPCPLNPDPERFQQPRGK